MSPDFEHPETPLEFEHVSEFALGKQLVICDAAYVASALASASRRNLQLSHTIDVEPGIWHAFTACAQPPGLDFLLLCHGSELTDDGLPAFDQADSPGLLPIDSDRLLALDADLRDQPAIQLAIAETTGLASAVTVAGAGVAFRVDRPGTYPVFVSPKRPRSVVFVVFPGD